jgi:DNA-binding NarL/FixJ family response regulator
MRTKRRILLADDHETVREGLRLLVNSQEDMEVVATAADGQDAVAQALRVEPDVAVIDISMPGMNGLTATARLHEKLPTLKILPLTRHADRSSVVQAFQAGASGYVLKQSRPSELLQAIRSVANGERYVDKALPTDELVSENLQPAGSRQPAALSPREVEVFRLIAWGATNKEIAARLKLSVKTVEAHKANGMRKLGMSGRLDIVRYAMHQGWLAESSEP